MKDLLKPQLDWLLIFVPAGIALEFLRPDSHALLFASASLAIIPLAGWMGRSTEHLAARTGEGIGGLLNATFGNAAELIIALIALREGLYDVVKASLTGSIIGNILLVMGAAFLTGGLRFKEQHFTVGGARIQATMMTLASIALVLPAAFHHLGGSVVLGSETELSLIIAGVMLVTYILGLIFSLHTHKHYFSGHGGEAQDIEDDHGEPWPIRRSAVVLILATALIAWMSEILVSSVEPAAELLGLTNVFVGVVVVAIIGNAAEHSTAILVALKNRMDLSLGIALGSSIQVALFVAPVIVVASRFIGPRPMDLVFTPMEVLAVVLAVIIANEISRDGESNWLEGVQLLMVYALIALVFLYLPESVSP